MTYIAFPQHLDLKKKKKIDLPTLPISGQKGKQTLYFFKHSEENLAVMCEIEERNINYALV